MGILLIGKDNKISKKIISNVSETTNIVIDLFIMVFIINLLNLSIFTPLRFKRKGQKTNSYAF